MATKLGTPRLDDVFFLGSGYGRRARWCAGTFSLQTRHPTNPLRCIACRLRDLGGAAFRHRTWVIIDTGYAYSGAIAGERRCRRR